MGSTPAPEQRSDAAVDGIIAAAMLRAERAVCLARIPFFGAILARFLLTSHVPPAAVALTAAPISIGILFSAVVLVAVRRPPRRAPFWLATVTIDAVACFCALLADAVWPTAQYAGVLHSADSAGVLVATIAAGFRLAPHAALLGGLLNVLGVVGLVAADRLVSGPRFVNSLDSASMLLIFVAGAATLAVLLAVTTRRLVHRGALAAVRADRAEQGLGNVLADHHDLRSLLTSALISAESIGARELADDLRRISRVVAEVRGRALGDLAALGDATPVDVEPVAVHAVELTGARHPGVAVRCEPFARCALAVMGGEPALHRILLNLLDNACEGDGVTRPSRVTLAVRPDARAGMVRLEVDDDGPGLPAQVASGSQPGASSKPGGLGIGLSVVRGLVEASGGTLRLLDREPTGARVSVSLPVATAAQGAVDATR